MTELLAKVASATRASALTVGLAIMSLGVAQPASLTVTETGSTLIFPLFKAWASEYTKIDPETRVTPSATNSGTGIDEAIANKVQIGTSDAYMSDNLAMAHRQILNIPLAISAQIVDANLPELRGTRLKLSGPVLAGIYSGTIREWDAEPIAALNRGVGLPHHAITPVRRADNSGDTFVFTQFLTFSTPTWEQHIGYGTSVNWPSVPGSLTSGGNEEMLQTIAHTPYAVGYLGGSFQEEASAAGLNSAMLENQDGKFVLPTARSITAAAASLTPRTPPDERLTLAFAPGADSYPLINYEYAIVSTRQTNPQVAAAISKFLLWCIAPQGGSNTSFLDPVHFIGLPVAIRALSEMQIAKIENTGS